MKAKKAIALAKDVVDLLPEKFTDVDYMNAKSTMYSSGFVAGISIISSLMENDDDEDLTPDNLANTVVAGCVLTSQFADVMDLLKEGAKDED